LVPGTGGEGWAMKGRMRSGAASSIFAIVDLIAPILVCRSKFGSPALF